MCRPLLKSPPHPLRARGAFCPYNRNTQKLVSTMYHPFFQFVLPRIGQAALDVLLYVNFLQLPPLQLVSAWPVLYYGLPLLLMLLLAYISRGENSRLSVSAAVGHAACTTANDIGATAIITASKSGETARLLSRFRPDAQIIACVLDETTRRQLNVYRGVTPLLMDYAHSTDELISMSVENAKGAGLIQDGDLVVVTAGVPVGVSGTTNMIKVHMVGDSLLAGVGIGSRNAKGEVCVCRSAAEAAKKFKPGQILVVPFTTNDELPFIREAAGVITEEAGSNSHSAIVGLTLNKAVIVGATNATRTLKDGMVISMDCIRGTVQLMAN